MIGVLSAADEPSLPETGRFFPERAGELQLATATPAKDAILLLKDHASGGAVPDYPMPGRDGIDFLKHIRPKCNALPFILFTGPGCEEIVIAAIHNGTDCYCRKGGGPAAQPAEPGQQIKLAVRRRRTDQTIVHFNRLCAVLSGINTTVVHAKTRDGLFAAICRITVEEGWFTMTWAGPADASLRMPVPAAHFGSGDDSPPGVQIPADDNPPGQGPGGRIARLGSHVICNAITREPGSGARSWITIPPGCYRILPDPVPVLAGTAAGEDNHYWGESHAE